MPCHQQFTVFIWLVGSAVSLRDIQLSVPEAIAVGSSVTFGCRWALDAGEALYTVKWYRGAQEFYRFVPKELPNTRVFSLAGINVDVSRSGAQQVVLRQASRALAGRYRCEVSADAPYFHTIYKSAYMRVVELPESPPQIHVQKSWYSTGDMLRANCTSSPADPPANLTWLVNGREVKGQDMATRDTQGDNKKLGISAASLEDANRIIFSPWDAISGYEDPVTDNIIDIPGNIDSSLEEQNDKAKPKGDTEYPGLTRANKSMTSKLNISVEDEKSNKSSSFSQLVIRIQSSDFYKGRVNVTCVSRVWSVWNASRELLLEEERPQLAPVIRSPNTSAAARLYARLAALTILNWLLYWIRFGP